MFVCGLPQSIVRLALAAILVAVCPGLLRAEDSTTRILGSLDIPVTLFVTRSALTDLDKCRAAFPEGDAKRYLTQAEELLIQGLLIGWNLDDPSRSQRAPMSLQMALAQSQSTGNRWTPQNSPPPIYLKSLANDSAVCRAALNATDPVTARAMIASVIGDLVIKARDCQSNGMGRTIVFKVKTIRGQSPDRGWTVYYKWLTVSNLVADEIPFPKMSTPAFNDLPPGLYRFRAEKHDPQSAAVTSSETKMCQVDEAHQECEVQVP
jgi:hypothetical protein